jgi:hypothetical protein
MSKKHSQDTNFITSQVNQNELKMHRMNQNLENSSHQQYQQWVASFEKMTHGLKGKCLLKI